MSDDTRTPPVEDEVIQDMGPVEFADPDEVIRDDEAATAIDTPKILAVAGVFGLLVLIAVGLSFREGGGLIARRLAARDEPEEDGPPEHLPRALDWTTEDFMSERGEGETTAPGAGVLLDGVDSRPGAGDAVPTRVYATGAEPQVFRRDAILDGPIDQAPEAERRATPRTVEVTATRRGSGFQAGPEADPEAAARRSPIFSGSYSSAQPVAVPAGAAGDAALAAAIEAQAGTDYQKQNMAGARAEWVASRRRIDADYYVDANVQIPTDLTSEIKSGTLIPIVMVTGVNSDLPGEVVAQITRPIYDSITLSNLLIPAGSTVVGSYDSNIAFAQERILIAWDKIVRTDGVNLSLRGMQATDVSGVAGLTGDIDLHLDQVAIGLAFASMFDLGSNALVAAAANVPGLSTLDSLLGGKERRTAAGDVAKRLADKWIDRQPTITILPGTAGSILVRQDIRIPPYGSVF